MQGYLHKPFAGISTTTCKIGSPEKHEGSQMGRGREFVGETGGHSVVIDGAPENGGKSGARPMIGAHRDRGMPRSMWW
jgi:hypothetical protein